MSEAKKVETVETVEKEYTLRDLEAEDLFMMTKIISAIGINEFKGCFQSDAVKKAALGEGGMSVKTIGFEVFFEAANVIIKNLHLCKEDLYIFLSSLSGIEVDQIRKMKAIKFIRMVKDLVKKEEFKDFFTEASELFK